MHIYSTFELYGVHAYKKLMSILTLKFWMPQWYEKALLIGVMWLWQFTFSKALNLWFRALAKGPNFW